MTEIRKYAKEQKKKRMIVMEKNKGFSVLKAFVMVVCIISVVISVLINIAFANDRVPCIFGRYIYVVDKDANLGNDPETNKPRIKTGTALIAKDADDVTLAKGDIVLCYPNETPDTLTLRSINAIITAEGEEDKYTTADATHEDNTGTITKDKVVAICTGYPSSYELGRLISFAVGLKGIAVLLILPCVILVVMLIVKIATSKDSDDEFDEQNFGFYNYEEEQLDPNAVRSHAKPQTPLFEPSQDIQPSSDLERKKMSIAENFSQKHINPDSPYQKEKEKERTMQFRTPPQHSAESSFAARNMGGQSSTAPTADALREEMLRKTAEAERTGSYSTKTINSAAEQAQRGTYTDNTGVLSKSQLAEMSRNDIPKTTPLRTQQSAYVPKKSSSPDISDIIKKSDDTKKRKSADAMSVDDLLRIIEDEKSKL